ncbi:MAG: phosphatidylglycerophosphatase A [Deltaproteobacteria bacterium]|nr:phosphatidylglycerophosphatase A [Deltaproteobacteria bacterium]
MIATGAGSGYAPFAPGTVGTIAGIPVYLLLSRLSWTFYLISVLILTLLAIYISREGEKIFNEKDSPRIVIDEIVGFQWTMFLVLPTVLHILLGFFLFRLFDIVKIFPAGYLQNRLPGGYGIVIDDVVAGMYSNIILLLVIKFWGI